MGLNGLEYITLTGSESFGRDNNFGIKIEIASTNMPYLKGDDAREIRIAGRRAADAIQKEVMRLIYKNSPKTAVATAKNREQIIDRVFGDLSIYVDEIPNGYCKEQCCEHLPWFIVTTKIGRIKIGWRKRVIEIDWEDTIETTEFADNLFPGEDVTKGNKYIHAWSVEDAKRYVKTIMENLRGE